MTTATKTHIAHRRQVALTTAQQVHQLIGVTQEEHFWMRFQAGINYLKLVTQGDEEQVTLISQSKVFWGWWTNHWSARDEDFVKELANEPNPRKRRVHYVNLHHPQLLFEEIGYHGHLLADSYAAIVKLLNHEIKGRKCPKKHE